MVLVRQYSNCLGRYRVNPLFGAVIDAFGDALRVGLKADPPSAAADVRPAAAHPDGLGVTVDTDH